MRALFRGVPLAGWLACLAVVLAVAGYFGFHALFVKVGRSVEQPFSGPAARNDLYVLQRYLEERGLEVRVARSWPQPLSDDALVMWFSSEPVPRELRSWLASGGQLWTHRDPDRDPIVSIDWTATPWPGEEVAQPDDEAVAGAEDEAEDEDDAAYWCRQGCLAAAQFRYGAGSLTLVHRYALRNERVSLGDTPARIEALLAATRRPRSVLIVTQLGSPWFGQLLLEHAPEALLALAVLLALWLWHAGKHFGPKQPAPRRERRQMLEHIEAVGTLAGRVGVHPLLSAARRELRRRLARRVPQAASLADTAFVAAIVETTDLPAADVRRALLDEPSGGGRQTIAIARAVQALWRKT